MLSWESFRLGRNFHTVFSQLNAPGVYFKLGMVYLAFLWISSLLGPAVFKEGVVVRFSLQPCNLLLHFKFIIQQINAWGAYLQFPLLYPAFNRENTVLKERFIDALPMGYFLSSTFSPRGDTECFSFWISVCKVHFVPTFLLIQLVKCVVCINISNTRATFCGYFIKMCHFRKDSCVSPGGVDYLILRLSFFKEKEIFY